MRGERIKYGTDMTDELELAYAITVHKSQEASIRRSLPTSSRTKVTI